MAKKDEKINPVAEPELEETVTEQQPDPRDAEIEELKHLIYAQQEQIDRLRAEYGVPAEAAQEAAEPKTEDEWEEYIEMFVPRHGHGQEQSFFVSVNFRNAQIPADGKMHKLRKPIALALQASLEAEAKAEKFADEIPHDAAPGNIQEMARQLSEMRRKLQELGID